MERCDVGDRVVSNLDTQGMRQRERFGVIGRDEQRLPGSCYATLTLRSLEDGRELRIVNGQLLLSRAK